MLSMTGRHFSSRALHSTSTYPIHTTPRSCDSPHRIGSGSSTRPLDESRDPVPDTVTLPSMRWFLLQAKQILRLYI